MPMPIDPIVNRHPKMLIRCFKTSLLLSLGTCFALVLAGCGGEPGLARVKGRITYKGKPVEKGEVFFTPEEPGKRGARGIIDSSGNYALSTYESGDGAYVGKHRVNVISQGPDKPIPPKMKGRMMEEDMQGTGDPLIPRKYFSAQSSGLSADVANSSNQFDFDLQD
ncbi:MAG: hypothetical protein ACKO5E_15940 [bacterium]